MSFVVLKFGGTALASPSQIQQAAKLVGAHVNENQKVVVVVSAMAGETDRLIGLAQQLNGKEGPAFDALIAAGEQVSTGLMALALAHEGFKASPLQGWQVPLETTDQFSRARLTGVGVENLLSYLNKDIIPVVAGFQGITSRGDITTFGRGGSDLTAVALACALKADKCILYKDVPGVLNGDPRVIEKTQLQERLSFEEMLELAGLGSKVIQSRAVEFAMGYGLDLEIKPLSGGVGTRITQCQDLKEKEFIKGIVVNPHETKITLLNTPISVSIKAQLFQEMASENIVIDMIIQHGSQDGSAIDDLSFTVAQGDGEKAKDLCLRLKDSLKFEDIRIQERVAKISLVGSGMRGHTHVAAKLFKVLSELGVTTYAVSTSELKLSILVGQHYANHVAQSLHQAFELDQPSAKKDSIDNVA